MVEGMRMVIVDDDGEADARQSAPSQRAVAPGPSAGRSWEPEPRMAPAPADVDSIIDSVLGGQEPAQTDRPIPERVDPWDTLSGVDQPPAGPVLLLPPSGGDGGEAR